MANKSDYRSGAHLINPADPNYFDDLLAFHRATFGEAVMESAAARAALNRLAKKGGDRASLARMFQANRKNLGTKKALSMLATTLRNSTRPRRYTF